MIDIPLQRYALRRIAQGDGAVQDFLKHDGLTQR